MGSMEFFCDFLFIFNNVLVYYERDVLEYVVFKILCDMVMLEMNKILKIEVFLKYDGLLIWK